MFSDDLKTFVIGRKLKKLRKKMWGLNCGEAREKLNKINWNILDKIVKYKLLKTLKHVDENSPAYRGKIQEFLTATSLEKVTSIIEKLSFTTPDEISKHPERFLSIPYSEVVGFHFTAGTTGERKKLYLSKIDLEQVIYNYYLGLLMHNLNHDDVVQIMYSFGIWQIGNLYQQALNRIGVKSLPTGNSIGFDEQLKFIKDFNTTTIVGTPSYVYQFARSVELPTKNRDKIKRIILGGEHLVRKRREVIEKELGGEVFLAYGMMEFGGGIASECEEHSGYHLMTSIYPEIVDVKTGEPVEKEEYGELVLTSLDKHAMPLVRYRTRDITRILDGECECGLNLTMIDYVKKRADDRITIGTAEKYYPIVFEELFDRIPEVKDYQIEITKIEERDAILVKVIASKPSHKLKSQIIKEFYEINSLRTDIEKTKTVTAPEIIFVNTLQNNGVKRRCIIDMRATA
ncbi:MAG: phenylacetate--CoA ligase family protein [Candidatus Odinarchaeia archaeon]